MKLALATLGLAVFSSAQSGLEGVWRGTVNMGASDHPLLLTVSKPGAEYAASLKLADGGGSIAVSRTHVEGDSLELRFKTTSIDGAEISGYQGSLDASRSTLAGTLDADSPRPLVFMRFEPRLDSDGVDIDVPFAPTMFRGGGKRHIVYELRVTNVSRADIQVKQIDVLSDGVLARFTGGRLRRILSKARISSTGSALAYIWVTLDEKAPTPATLRHKVIAGAATAVGAVTPVQTQPITIGPPLRGEGWYAANGPNNDDTDHRRDVLWAGGTVKISQRFAIDWIQSWPDGKWVHGSDKDNRSYRGYGAEAVAVADGVVVTVKDGMAENVPGPVHVARGTYAGNYAVLDIGQGRFAWYIHLQPGSLRVKAGERVTRGQVIGLVGNSGNSTAPHLHFHVSDGGSFVSDGVPYEIDSFEVQRKDKTYERREGELPMSREMARFN